MPQANDVHGTVFKNSSAVLMARIVDANGLEITPTEISAVSYTVAEVDLRRPDSAVAVSGHDNVSLNVADVVFGSLQTDNLWTVDAQGYNFRHELDVSQNEAFPVAGAHYQVRYVFIPNNGQKVIVRFRLRAI